MTISGNFFDRVQVVILFSMIVFGSAAVGRAAPPVGEFLVMEALAAADLVFHGVVTKVDYRAAKDGTPHAFVTYDIRQIIRGGTKPAGKMRSVVLRFIGGPRGDGSFLIVSTVPNFAAGDEDVLFVRDNGIRHCPLVSCPFGRFRVLDKGVYQALATPVVGVHDGRIKAAGPKRTDLLDYRFPAPSFDALYARPEVREAYKAQNQTADVEALRKAYRTHAPKQIVMRPTDLEAGDGETGAQEPVAPIGLAAFLDVLVSASDAVPGTPAPFKSADAEVPFDYEPPKPAAPPPLKPRKSERRVPNGVEKLERFQDEQYNPVIK